MTYRSNRFPAGELKGLEKVWKAIDGLEASGLPVRTEVMAGKSYRRQLTEATAIALDDPNYVLQAVLQVPPRESRRISARYFVEESRRILSDLNLPGSPILDIGGLNGLDPSATTLTFGSTGFNELDVLEVYAPWVSSRWTEAGRSCVFFCGIEPPEPKPLMQDYPQEWDERAMRKGRVVYEPAPESLQTY